MIKTVTVRAVPSQRFNVVLDQQKCTIILSQKRTGMYLSLLVDNVPIVTGVLCRNLVGVVRHGYLGFKGELTFLDTQGMDDPRYDGLGSRFFLMYVNSAV